MNELVQRAVSRAVAAGATYADARALVRRHQSINTKNGAPIALSDLTEQGIGVRVIADGAWGFAATASLNNGDVDAAAELAVRIARASASLAAHRVELAPLAPAQVEWQSEYAVDPFAVPLEQKLGLLLDADKVMREVSGVRVATGELNFIREEKWFASSEGAELVQTRIQSGGMIQAIAEGEGEVQRRSYPSSLDGDNANRGWEFVAGFDLVGHAHAPRRRRWPCLPPTPARPRSPR